MPSKSKYDHLSDDDLLRAYRAGGDNEWLGHLLQRYTALLFGVALKYLKNKTLAEDAVQQVFVKALTNLPVEEILNFKGWLYVLMRNHCLQQLRDTTYHADESILAAIPAEEAMANTKWDEHTPEQLTAAIDQLGAEQREAITLFYLKKFSYDQIIARTGFTFMQVKSYIQNGKRNLKSILTKNGNQQQ